MKIDLGRNFLTQLNQNTICITRVEESNQLVVCSPFGLRIEDREPLLLHAPDFGMDVGYFKCNVMDALSFFFDEFENGRAFLSSLQKLNFTVPDLEKGGLHRLTLHGFLLIGLPSENLGEEGIGVFKAFDGDADVLDFHFMCFG